VKNQFPGLSEIFRASFEATVARMYGEAEKYYSALNMKCPGLIPIGTR
jgi:hypothetical protein